MVRSYDKPWQLGLVLAVISIVLQLHRRWGCQGQRWPTEAAAAIGVTITSVRELTTTRVYSQHLKPASAPAAYGIAKVTEQLELVPVKQMNQRDQYGNPLPRGVIPATAVHVL